MKHPRFEDYKNRNKFEKPFLTELRNKSIYFHKNIDSDKALFLFENVINTQIATNIVTPDGTRWLYVDSKVEKKNIIS